MVEDLVAFTGAQFPLTAMLALMTGAAAGAVGAFLILRRMALVGDALTHVALPGIGLALLIGWNPFLGGFAFLLAAVLGIFILEHHTRVYSEALVGLLFTIALAVGIIVTEEPELFEALFGDIRSVAPTMAIAGTAVAAGALALTLRVRNALLLSTIAPDLAHAQGIHRKRIEIIFLLLVALIVALGIRVVGTLLMGSLVIVPAIAAKNIGGSFRRFLGLSVLGGAGAALGGIFLTAALPAIPPGASVTLVGALLFVLSLPFRQHD